jgi:starch-binding outer membrane protein, SusD/RagB family
MKKLIYVLVVSLFVLPACQEYVTNLEPLTNQIRDNDLNFSDPAILNGFLIGLQVDMERNVDELFVNADGLSDAFYFDLRVLGATYPQYAEVDVANMLDDNAVPGGPFTPIHQFRAKADTALYKINNGIYTFADDESRRLALYSVYLYGGQARYLLATYYALRGTIPGSPVDKSPLISSTVLYADAIARWKLAVAQTSDATKKRMVNSMIARAYLFLGQYSEAATYASQGMVQGDAPWLAQYNVTNENNYRVAAGQIRVQFAADNRFAAYITATPSEANRIKVLAKTNKGYSYYIQNKYLVDPLGLTTVAPIELITWQETQLMRAELVLRGAGAGDALALVNGVRAFYSIPALASITLSTAGQPSIYEERDKELCFRGLRLVDQRRFGKFHVAGGMQYFPIPRGEVTRNPYLQ